MKKTALLIDGGWFSKGLGKTLSLPSGWPRAATVIKNARAVLEKDEELFRIFYYDCEPFDREVESHSLRRPAIGLEGVSRQALLRRGFHHELGLGRARLL